MTKLSFFTAVKYQHPEHSPQTKKEALLEGIDNYFYLRGKKAYVIGSSKDGRTEKVILVDDHSSFPFRVLKGASYVIFPVPVVLLITKAVLRSTHRFKVIDPKEKLERGMDVSEETIAQVKEVIQQVVDRSKKAKIEGLFQWLDRSDSPEEIEGMEPLQGTKVFKLKDHPNIVFKMGLSSEKTPHNGRDLDNKAIMDERFENMIKAKQVCLLHKLEPNLVIPSAKKFTMAIEGAQCTVIAEQRLDFDAKEGAQEELYAQYASELNETVIKLVNLISKTKLNDVVERNVPILREAPDYQGPRRVGLVDLEHMGSSVEGIIGSRKNGSCGLIGFLQTEEQIDLIFAEARKQGVLLADEQIRKAKDQRLKHLEFNRTLKTFHHDHDIVTGEESIEVNLDALDLPLDEEGKISVTTEEGKVVVKEIVTMRKVAEAVVSEINEQIAKRSLDSSASIQDKRAAWLYICEDSPLAKYSNLGGADEERWIHRIIMALVKKEYLFKLIKVDGYGYTVQA